MNELDKFRLTKNIATISAVFCVLVSLLLLLNYWQFASNEPLESKTLEVLVERLNSEPNNAELKQEIRNFDLLARKAYFNSQWQVKTGAYLLLFGAIVFAIALRFYYSIKSKIEEPAPDGENELTGRLLSQRWLIVSGAVMLILALIASFATVDHLNQYSADNIKSESMADISIEAIEIIDVAKTVEKISGDSLIKKSTEDLNSSSKNKNNLSETEELTSEIPEPVEKKKIISPSSSSTVSSLTSGQVVANYNGFRGPWGNGISFSKNIPIAWDGASGENLLWKTAIPRKGYNSPVVWENKIFLSGGDNEVREVYCFDKNSGKLLWTKKADNIKGSPAKQPRVTEDTGLAAPSLTTDGQSVFAIFANGDIISFDINGDRKWARNLGVPDNHYGHSSSLITWGGKLFVQYDTNKGGKVLALNVSNGETLWQTIRSSKISWASPVIADVSGKKQLILTADPNVAAYELETGKELWAVECMMGEVGPSVAFGEGLVFACNEYARLVAIDLNNGSIKWEDDEYMPEVASPVVSNGLLFIATSYGVFVCYDAKSGEKLWEQDYGSGFYASPVIADNKVYALDTDGVMHILAVSREVKEFGSPKLGEEGYTTPAFSDGHIYIRGNTHLYCFGK